MGKKLKSLTEHNELSAGALTSCFSNEPQLNGIACPKCGEELYDSDPMSILTSMPPQKNVACLKEGCRYSGYRVV